MLIPLEYVATLLAVFGSGFSIGFLVGRNHQPTITARPHIVCPEREKHGEDVQNWSHTCLIYKNGKVSSVECKQLSKRKCLFSGQRCRFLNWP